MTPELYAQMKENESALNDAGKAAMREYETANPQHGRGQRFSPEAPPSVGQVPKDVPPDEPVDTTLDHGLPNASGLKTLLRPPEYVAKNPLNGIKHVVIATLKDPLGSTHESGPGAGVYHEPSEKQFQADMGSVMQAKGYAPDSPQYDLAFKEYKDRKWVQAYDQAEANDVPLTRAAYVPRSGMWEQLKGALAEMPDVATAFAKGFASGGTLHATDALETDADREQAERDPIARGAGELAGSLRTTGPLAKIAQGASKAVPWLAGATLGPGLAARFPAGLGRLVSSAVAGGVTGVADLAGHSAAEAVRGVPNAKERFVQSLPGALETGAAFGAGGQLLAEGGNAVQKSVLGATPELGQLRPGGGNSDILFGVRPGKDVAANIEAAREPIPGEAKARPEGNATEIAAKKIQQPLTAANAASHASAHQSVAAEQDAAIAADPKLQEQLPATKTAQAAVDWALAKLQPEARAGYLPGISKPLSSEVLPGADISEVQKLAPRLWKPRLVTAVDASSVANRARGRSITLDEARKLGIPLGELSKELGAEGVPLNAPPIPSEAAPVSAGTNFDAAASKANDIASETSTAPELQDFLNRSRKAENAAERDGAERATSSAVTRFLRAAEERGATYDGPTYRGTSQAELDQLLKNGETVNTWSVSKDSEGATHFAKKGGVLLEIEPGAGAVPVDGIEGSNTFGEALVPKGQRFEVAGERTENGLRIVKLRRVEGPDLGGGATTEDVFGQPAEKLTPLNGPVRGATPGRAKPPPAPEAGSDWDNPEETRARFDYMYGEAPGRAESPAPTPDDVTPTRVSEYKPRAPRERWATPSSPSGPPSEFSAADLPSGARLNPEKKVPGTGHGEGFYELGTDGMKMEAAPGVPSLTERMKRGAPPRPGAPLPPPTAPSAPSVGGIPESEYRVILEPRRFDAKTFEEILGDVDRKAGSGSATAQPDPAWKALQRAIREDRAQFGKGWADLIAKHHELLNQVEQRSYHAGMVEKKPYSEMQGSSQQTLNGKLVDFPGGSDSARALRELAAQADPAVQHDLEVLGAQNAYSKLKGMASPKIGETLGSGGLSGHLRGFGPAVKLRADALGRAVSAGPTGEPTITPRLLAFVRQNAPQPKYLPGIGAMGGGALGLKAGSVYSSTRDRGARAQTLTPAERQFLDNLITATHGLVEPKQEAP